nr:immunoglobulin heavy chain junction region [Mus musculus]
CARCYGSSGYLDFW